MLSISKLSALAFCVALLSISASSFGGQVQAVAVPANMRVARVLEASGSEDTASASAASAATSAATSAASSTTSSAASAASTAASTTSSAASSATTSDNGSASAATTSSTSAASASSASAATATSAQSSTAASGQGDAPALDDGSMPGSQDRPPMPPRDGKRHPHEHGPHHGGPMPPRMNHSGSHFDDVPVGNWSGRPQWHPHHHSGSQDVGGSIGEEGDVGMDRNGSHPDGPHHPGNHRDGSFSGEGEIRPDGPRGRPHHGNQSEIPDNSAPGSFDDANVAESNADEQ